MNDPERITSDHLTKSDPTVADLDADFAAELRAYRNPIDFTGTSTANVELVARYGKTSIDRQAARDELKFRALSAQEDEARQAIADESAWSRTGF